MEHRERARLRGQASLAGRGQLTRSLFRVDFKRPDSFPEHSDLLVYALQVVFEVALQRFESLLLG